MAKTAAGQATQSGTPGPTNEGNGTETGVKNGRKQDSRTFDPALVRLEQALRAATAGDFSVRLQARRKDAIGRLESAFNDLAARNAALEAELVRIGQIIGREGRMTERAHLADADGAWSTTIDSINGLIDDLVRPTTEVARVIVAVAEGDLSPEDGARDRGPAGQGRIRPDRDDRQLDGRPALELRRRGHARRPGGRNRGQAGRSGEGTGGRRHLGGPHRLGELHGVEPDFAGSQHR